MSKYSAIAAATTTIWKEEDHCSPPLAMKRESVLDQDFNDIELLCIEYDMEKCKFTNRINLSQSCDQPGRFRKESDHPEWPFDQDYLCDRHYRQVKTRVMRKG
jgi:hypothetical protein